MNCGELELSLGLLGVESNLEECEEEGRRKGKEVDLDGLHQEGEELWQLRHQRSRGQMAKEIHHRDEED